MEMQEQIQTMFSRCLVHGKKIQKTPTESIWVRATEFSRSYTEKRHRKHLLKVFGTCNRILSFINKALQAFCEHIEHMCFLILYKIAKNLLSSPPQMCNLMLVRNSTNIYNTCFIILYKIYKQKPKNLLFPAFLKCVT